jgi:hypothetical protein
MESEDQYTNRYDNVTRSPLLLQLERKRTEGYVIVSSTQMAYELSDKMGK